MPTTTVSDALTGGARGKGMQVRFDPVTLQRLYSANAAGGFDLDYVVGFEGGGGFVAKLRVRLEDEHGLFTGASIIAVLGNLVAQAVEARLSEGGP